MSRDLLAARLVVFSLALACASSLVQRANADVKLPNIFGSHMVLQQGQKDRVWGAADPNEDVTVSIAGQSKSTKAGADGNWSVVLDALSVGGPHTLTVQGKNKVVFDDVLVGEVWICSGQSNMQWSVSQANDGDLETRTAKYPRIRLISVPQVGTQEPQVNFNGQWEVCSPDTVGQFSAVGYFFGRQLFQTLDVPIGLIDDAWGGSACEAWIRRDLLAADGKYKSLLDSWTKREQNYDHDKAEFETKLAAWKVAAQQAKADGKQPPPPPQNPDGAMRGNARPANIYNGVLKPTIGFGIRGVVWYQGESNAGRAYQYRDLFPLMIKSWRDEWAIGDFSFYWVQLADFKGERPEPAESDWAELREAQTMTMDKLPRTGEAVIIDVGEGKDIHPRNKQDVGKRLARWALNRDYGLPIACESPRYASMETQGQKIVLKFSHAKGLRTFDVGEPRGFAVAAAPKPGEQPQFVWANAKIVGNDQIEVWSDKVPVSAAVRYAWADNPVCNVYSTDGLPLTPFRTDEWPGVTVGK